MSSKSTSEHNHLQNILKLFKKEESFAKRSLHSLASRNGKNLRIFHELCFGNFRSVDLF